MFVQPLPDHPPAEDIDAAETLVGRRVAARLPVLVPAEFEISGCSNPVVVADVSETGARLRMIGAPPKGAKGVLRWQDIDCHCEVVWSASGSFGVRFDQPVPPPSTLVSAAKCTRSNPFLAEIPAPPLPSGHERRSSPRRQVERSAEVRQADRWIKVRLKGISSDGFEVGWFPGCQDRQPISLRGPGLPKLHGRVIWSDNLTVGCKLSAPLHPAVLEHVIAQMNL